MKVTNYRYYKNEQLEINSIDSKLSVEEKKVRRYLMNYVIDNHGPFNLNNLQDIAFTLDMNVNTVKNLIGNLLSTNAMVSDEEKNINFIYPVSALETDHIVRLSDGRKFYAMCAIDAMGSAFTFKQNVTIKSKCSNTSKEINITIKDGELRDYSPVDLHILHVDLNKNTNWSGNC